MACRIYWNNLWDDYTITETSEHENFPAENTQHRDFNKEWRSNYGAGSGWGNFLIAAGVNNRLDFEETAAAELTASLTAGDYNADELCTEIKTQLEVIGASTYTITYSDTTNKFTFASDRVGGGGTFKILWLTGTNTATSVGTTIGFDITADDADAASHTADYWRTHTDERVSCDFGAAQDVYGVIIRGHNFESMVAGTVKAEFSTDNWATVSESINFTMQDDILVLEWDIPKTYRYCRIWIGDWSNSDLYVAMGVVFMGGHFQPTRTFLEESQYFPTDPSALNQSEDGQYSSFQLSHYWIKSYGFIMGSADKSTFESVFAEVGTSKGFFFCEDTSSYLTTTNYVKLNSFQFQSLLHSTDVWRLDVEMEKLR